MISEPGIKSDKDPPLIHLSIIGKSHIKMKTMLAAAIALLLSLYPLLAQILPVPSLTDHAEALDLYSGFFGGWVTVGNYNAQLEVTGDDLDGWPYGLSLWGVRHVDNSLFYESFDGSDALLGYYVNADLAQGQQTARMRVRGVQGPAIVQYWGRFNPEIPERLRVFLDKSGESMSEDLLVRTLVAEQRHSVGLWQLWAFQIPPGRSDLIFEFDGPPTGSSLFINTQMWVVDQLGSIYVPGTESMTLEEAIDLPIDGTPFDYVEDYGDAELPPKFSEDYHAMSGQGNGFSPFAHSTEIDLPQGGYIETTRLTGYTTSDGEDAAYSWLTVPQPGEGDKVASLFLFGATQPDYNHDCYWPPSWEDGYRARSGTLTFWLKHVQPSGISVNPYLEARQHDYVLDGGGNVIGSESRTVAVTLDESTRTADGWVKASVEINADLETFEGLEIRHVFPEATGLTNANIHSALFVDDFSFDARSIKVGDLVFQNTNNGGLSVWFTDREQVLGTFSYPVSGGGAWRIAAVASMEGGNCPPDDLIWQNAANGKIAVWLQDGTEFKDARWFVNQQGEAIQPGGAWRIAAVADINRDGWQDLVWQNLNNGRIAVWFMEGNRVVDTALFDTQPGNATWRVTAMADLDADGNDDLIWQNARNGTIAWWRMDGTRFEEGFLFPHQVGNPTWKLVAFQDMDGELWSTGRNSFTFGPDLVWQNTRTGQAAVWLLDLNLNLVSSALLSQQAGAAWQIRNQRPLE